MLVKYIGKHTPSPNEKYVPQPKIYNHSIKSSHIEYKNFIIDKEYYFQISLVCDTFQYTYILYGKTIEDVSSKFRKSVSTLIKIFGNLTQFPPTNVTCNIKIGYNNDVGIVYVKYNGKYFICKDYDHALSVCDAVCARAFPMYVGIILGDIRTARYETIKWSRSMFSARYKYVEKYGWTIPSEWSLYSLNEFLLNKKVLEIGAGKCVTSILLKTLGRDITTTDIGVSEYYTESDGIKSRVDYIIDAVSAAKMFTSTDTLMMIWPPLISKPYGSSSSNDEEISDPFFDALRTFKGRYLVYIGEPLGGCTGSEKMNKYIMEMYDITYIPIWNWEGIHDIMMLCTRKFSGNIPGPKTYRDALLSRK